MFEWIESIRDNLVFARGLRKKMVKLETQLYEIRVGMDQALEICQNRGLIDVKNENSDVEDESIITIDFAEGFNRINEDIAVLKRAIMSMPELNVIKEKAKKKPKKASVKPKKGKKLACFHQSRFKERRI